MYLSIRGLGVEERDLPYFQTPPLAFALGHQDEDYILKETKKYYIIVSVAGMLNIWPQILGKV